MVEKAKSLVLRITRAAISVALICWLLCSVPLDEFEGALVGSRWWLFGLSTLVMLLRPVIAAYRWQIMLAVGGIRVSLGRLFHWYMIGGFFNLMLPTSLGGDVMRLYHLARHSGRKADTVASVLMERILGFLALIAMAMVGLAATPVAWQNPKMLAGLLAVCLAYAALLIGLFHRGVSRAVVRLMHRVHLDGLGAKLERGYDALHSLGQHRSALALAFLCSVAFQAVGVFCVYLIGLSLGLGVPLAYYFLSVPLIWLISMAPISIGGMGVRDGGFVLFFTALGVTSASALLLSLLSFAQIIAVGLVGGAFHLADPYLFPNRPSRGTHAR